MAWWSGLAKKEVRLALERLADEWETVTLSPLPGEYYILRDHLARLNALKPNSTPQVTLLPLLDPYMMGYKDRVRYLDPDRNQFVFDKGGNAVATVLIDGRVIGVWDASGSPPRLVKVYLWDDVGTGLLKIITTRTKEIAAFLGGTDVQVKYCESMVPLTQRTAGGFMTPLKDS